MCSRYVFKKTTLGFISYIGSMFDHSALAMKLLHSFKRSSYGTSSIPLFWFSGQIQSEVFPTSVVFVALGDLSAPLKMDQIIVGASKSWVPPSVADLCECCWMLIRIQNLKWTSDY